MMEMKKLVPELRFREFDGEWRKVTLGDTSEIVGGGTPDTENEELWNGNHQWFTPTELKSKYISASKRTLSDLGLKKSSAKLLPKGSLLFSSRATVGDVSIAERVVCTNQGFQSFIVNRENNNEFLYNWIIKNKNLFLRRASGSTFLEISKKEILKLNALVPSLPEQQKIASFLSAVDEKIQQLTKKKELLEHYKKGVMQQLFSGKLRFKDDTSTGLSAGNGKDYPEWEEKRLGEVLDLFHGYQFRSTDFTHTGLAIIKISNVIGNQLNLEGISFINENRYDEFKKFEICKGDILMSLTGNIGRVIEVGEMPFKMIQNYRVGKFIPFDLNTISRAFAKYLLMSDAVFGRFGQLSNQSAQANFGKQDMDKIHVTIPILEEQQKIATYLSSIDTKIESVNQQITQTQTFKKGLLQQLFV